MNNKLEKFKSLMSSVFFLSATLILIFIMVYGIGYVYSKKENANMPIYKVDTKDNKLALSFDVAWGSNNIDEILFILDKYNIKATFFLVGSWVDDNEKLVSKIYEKGHEIGNHSNTHANTKELSKENIVEEIQLTSEKIEKITGDKPTLYRPPFGDVDNKTLEVCESLGYKIIKWDVDSMDWKEIGPNHVIERVMKSAEPGSIVLFHSNINNVEDYLDSIIFNLKKYRYEMVKVSDLVHKDNYMIDSNGVQKVKK